MTDLEKRAEWNRYVDEVNEIDWDGLCGSLLEYAKTYRTKMPHDYAEFTGEEITGSLKAFFMGSEKEYQDWDGMTVPDFVHRCDNACAYIEEAFEDLPPLKSPKGFREKRNEELKAKTLNARFSEQLLAKEAPYWQKYFLGELCGAFETCMGLFSQFLNPYPPMEELFAGVLATAQSKTVDQCIEDCEVLEDARLRKDSDYVDLMVALKSGWEGQRAEDEKRHKAELAQKDAVYDKALQKLNERIEECEAEINRLEKEKDEREKACKLGYLYIHDHRADYLLKLNPEQSEAKPQPFILCHGALKAGAIRFALYETADRYKSEYPFLQYPDRKWFQTFVLQENGEPISKKTMDKIFAGVSEE